MFSVGDTITLRIQDVVYRGNGLARLEGAVVFVPGTVPGELVRAEVSAARKNFFEARLLEILEPSPDRIESCACLPDGTIVPGCVYSHLAYKAEVSLKDRQLKDFFRRFDLSKTEFLPPFASPSSLHYRNKVVFHAQRSETGEMRLGYLGDDNRTVVDIPVCPLACNAINFEWERRRASLAHEMQDGDSITFRHTEADGVVSWIGKPPAKAPWLTEQTDIGPLSVPLDGFFQVNPAVARELVRQVREWMAAVFQESGAHVLLDLYCGVGVFALAGALSGIAHVVGIESGRKAISAARSNARKLGVPHVRFYARTVAEVARQAFGGIDLRQAVVVVDPPRQGMEPATTKALVRYAPPYLIYVSCDPATLTRDLKPFLAAGYRIRSARVFDMFPRTLHFESAVLLSR